MVISRLQPVNGHVCIDLRRCERSVTKQLLYATKVRAAVEKMGRRTVPKAMRT